MAVAIKNYDELPLTLKVEEMAEILGVSRKVAYKIANEENLAVRVGEKRLVIPKDRLINYLNK